MNKSLLKKELYDFYLGDDATRAKEFASKCFAILDARVNDGMSVMAQKLLQYDVICEEFEPVIFKHCPYYFETADISFEMTLHLNSEVKSQKSAVVLNLFDML